MRKYITYILLLAMVFSLTACRAKKPDTTTPPGGESEYTTQDVLLKRATDLAQQVALAVNENYLQSVGISSEISANATVFSAAADPAAVSRAAFLRTNRIDLPSAIAAVWNSDSNTSQVTCASSLKISTQFYCSTEFSGNIAVYLQYSSECHFLVYFESRENQLIAATVYPLFSQAANALLNKYFSNVSMMDAAEIKDACAKAASANFIAPPLGGSADAAHYKTMSEYMLGHTSVLNAKELSDYTTDPATINQIIEFSKSFSGNASSVAVYRFPANLDASMNRFTASQVKDLARQNLYLSWTDVLCSNFSSECLVANQILHNALHVDLPSTIVSESEEPVLIVLDFGDYTGIITLYPNEYNTYLYTIRCLPCSIVGATAMLSQYGAEVMQ